MTSGCSLLEWQTWRLLLARPPNRSATAATAWSSPAELLRSSRLTRWLFGDGASSGVCAAEAGPVAGAASAGGIELLAEPML